MVEESEIAKQAKVYSEELIAKTEKENEKMIEEAKQKLTEMVEAKRSEAEALTAEAVAKAEEVADKANKYSVDVRSATTAFVDKVMKTADDVLQNSLDEIRQGCF